MNKNLTVGEIWDKRWENIDVNKFKDNAFKHDPWTKHHKPIIEKYIKEIDRNGVFFEAGCGMGHWCFHVSEKYGIKSVGVDVAEETIDKLQKNCHNLARFAVDDLNKSKLESDSFDMLISLGVIEHFKDSGLMMKNLYRVLKPNGIGIITVPNVYSVHTITRPILQLLNKWDIGYEKSFSPKKLKNLSLSNGFKIVEYGVLPSGDMFGCFLNNIPLVGKIFEKISLFIEKRQNIFGFISFVVVKK
ncbi:MAG: class I SAM-dependent methyltransferase [bacterium]